MAKLYETVKNLIRQQIASDVYSVGSKIPSESQLVQALNVSAITVRRALRDLVMEGLLEAHQGLGVFVADNRQIVRSLRSDFQTSLSQEIVRSGLKPSIKPLSAVNVTASSDPILSKRANFPPDTLLHRVEKLILADGRPISVERDFLPIELLDSCGEDIDKEYLVPLLIKKGVRVSFIDYRIEGGSASEIDAPLLDFKNGFPILKVQYVPMTSNGKPLAFGYSVSRADRIAYDFHVNVVRDPLEKAASTGFVIGG